MQSPVRSSSCRGVSFEISRHESPLPLMFSDQLEPRIIDNSLIRRSNSKPSSHFCDIELEEEQDHECGDRGSADNDEVVLKIIDEDVTRKKEDIRNVPVRKQQPRLSIMLLDQGLFTVYKRLFVVCLCLNITALVLAATGHFDYARKNAALFSIANIFIAILSRNEVFWWVMFWMAVKIFGRSWMPLKLKTLVTSFLQSPGGIHSSSGVSSIAWLVYALVLILKNRNNASPEIIGVASTILSLLCLTAMAAFPLIRHLHHNVFERIHRFAGWSALSLLWLFLILNLSYVPMTDTYNMNKLGSRLFRKQEFWFTLCITVLIVLPWLTVRRVPVKVMAPSSHASLLKFDGGVGAGVLGRISPSPLSEWHAFGIISDGKQEHMMLVGAVGDYTKSLVANPPSHLWIRQVHFVGMPYLVNMYDRILLVATGSGVCVYLSYLLQPCRANWSLLWVAKGIEMNFGKEILDIVSRQPKDKVIVHDTAVQGRPDVARMSVDCARKWGAEVVFVTSNPQGSRDVIRACKTVGIPAFAPIWDS